MGKERRGEMNLQFDMQIRDKACTICSGVFGKYKSKRRCDTCRGGRNWRLAEKHGMINSLWWVT